jgi:iron complex outermembrane recepter protein
MRTLSAKFGIDLDGSPINIADTSFNTNQRQYSQELQLTGIAFDQKLDWVVGLYYFHERGDLTDFVPFSEGLVQVLGENLFRNESYAGFVNLSYALTNDIGLTFGLRHTDEDKKFEGRQRDLNALPSKLPGPARVAAEDHPDPNDLTRIYPLGVQGKDFKDLSVRLGAEYRLGDDILTYASYSQGTKSGGFTTRLLVPEPMPNVAPDFDEETADSYEIGVKSRLLEGRLQLNVAAFYTQYDDIQVTVQRNISPTFENAGEGVIRGVEAEFDSIVTDGLRISGGVGVLDAQYSKLQAGTVLDRGDRFVNTPNFSANLTTEYTMPLRAAILDLDGEMRFQIGLNHKSNVANDAENNPLFFEKNINVVNGSITYASNRSNWEVTLGVRNLTDTRHVVSGFENPGIGFSNAIFSRPREFYLTVRFAR